MGRRRKGEVGRRRKGEVGRRRKEEEKKEWRIRGDKRNGSARTMCITKLLVKTTEDDHKYRMILSKTISLW